MQRDIQITNPSVATATDARRHALLANLRQLVDAGAVEDASRLCRDLLTMSPQDGETLHLAGILAYRRGNLAQAETYLKQAATIDPQHAATQHCLGNVYRRMNRLVMSEKCFQRALSSEPDDASLLYDLGVLYQTGQQIENAESCYARCLEIDPGHVGAYNNMGLLALGQNKLQRARRLFEKAISLKGDFTGALINLGCLLRKTSAHAEALECFQRAAVISPKQAHIYTLMGDTLQTLGKTEDAIASYQRAVALKPTDAVGWLNLGTAFQDKGRLKDAFACYQKSLKLDADLPQAYLNMGILYRNQKRYPEALAAFVTAIGRKPDYENALAQMVHLLISVCQWPDLAKHSLSLDGHTAKWLAVKAKPAETPFLNIIRHQDPRMNFKVASAWSDAISQSVTQLPQTNRAAERRAANAKIRLGYLSANFKNHPTAELVRGLLQRHDRNRFDVFVYAYGKDSKDDTRQAIVQAADRFKDLDRLSDEAAAAAIRDDRVDILIDLMGHTRDSRLRISAARPAPLQVRYLGMAGTTGGDFFDYIIVDDAVCPPSDAPFYSEKPVYLPDCFQVNSYREHHCFQREQKRAAHGEPPFIYCAFSTAYKIDRRVFSAWMRILQRTPNSKLWLMPEKPLVTRNLLDAAQSLGVRPERIAFQEKLPMDKHLLRLSRADLALDTLAVSGGATTSDALWAGVPVLSVRGKHFASRLSSSLLRAIGLSELVFDDLDAYERCAVELYSDPRRLGDLKSKLHQHRRTTALFDTSRFSQNLETAYRLMWQRYVDGLPPTMLRVEPPQGETVVAV